MGDGDNCSFEIREKYVQVEENSERRRMGEVTSLVGCDDKSESLVEVEQFELHEANRRDLRCDFHLDRQRARNMAEKKAINGVK